ncbi:chymotrypsin-1-like [Temnothorax curvispinosus]|uniref:Chymotrypsin-1-like n=1 Tax=Temnothorax curvispinosus TaxID=300111 RepID=A0A6J1RN04_9HYME|nr:chymotrypsin-1-like [Temnothorax curvispinosus]
MRALACLVFIALAYAVQDASVGKFPYQVSLRYDDKHDCGGSIINKRNILTAASCVDRFKNLDKLDKLKAHVGTNFLNESGDVYDIESVSIHEDYDIIRWYYIALVHLKTPIYYNELVQPINLMTSDENLKDKSCTLTGWGSKNADVYYGEKLSNNLQEIELSVYPQENCERLWDAENTQICTWTRKGAQACNGNHYDTGSPLVANGFQIGIVSYFFPCAMGLPNVHTRVSSFLTWIMANLKN